MADAAFRSAAEALDFDVSSLAVGKPAGVVADDALFGFLLIASSGTPPTVTGAPSGWTQRATGTGTGFGGLNLRWYWYSKLAGGSEPSSYTWTISASADVVTGDVFAYDNPKTAGFWQAISTVASGTGTTATANGVTTDQTNQTVIGVFYHAIGLTTTPPSGMTERNDGTSLAVDDYVVASPGATGTKAATVSSSDTWLAWLIGVYGEDSAPVGGLAIPIVHYHRQQQLKG